MLERVQSIMTYKRIKTETTFQYSLPWDVCSCSLTSWLCFYSVQLYLNCHTPNYPSLVSVYCSSLCCSNLFTSVREICHPKPDADTQQDL